jgi:hypothetical protein
LRAADHRRGLVIRGIYAACLLVATINHIRAVALHGWFPTYLPWLTASYWNSLTFLDPLAAALLFVRPKLGIVTTFAIIVTDVVHNLWFTATYARSASPAHAIATSPFLLAQMAFLTFVALTFSIAWWGVPHAQAKAG